MFVYSAGYAAKFAPADPSRFDDVDKALGGSKARNEQSLDVPSLSSVQRDQ
jgi:hypothetical protein